MATEVKTEIKKSKIKEPIRVKGDPPIYLDLVTDSESPKMIHLHELIKARLDLKHEEEMISLRRKEADSRLMKEIDSFNADGILFSRLDDDGDAVHDGIVDRVVSRSGEKADKKFLEKKLSPNDYKKAFKPGTPYAFIKAERNEARATKIRDGLEE